MLFSGLPKIQIFYNLRRSPEAAGIVFRHFGAQLRKANHFKQVVRSTLLHLLIQGARRAKIQVSTFCLIVMSVCFVDGSLALGQTTTH